MKQRKIKIMLKDGATCPEYKTPNSSGVDVRCLEDFTLYAHKLNISNTKLVSTGIYLELPDDVEVQVRPRSGLAIKKGITVLNSPGTVDADYRGEVKIILINHGNETVSFKKGDRIAQLVFVENVVQADFEIVNEIDVNTERGDGGFGHTGKN